MSCPCGADEETKPDVSENEDFLPLLVFFWVVGSFGVLVRGGCMPGRTSSGCDTKSEALVNLAAMKLWYLRCGICRLSAYEIVEALRYCGVQTNLSFDVSGVSLAPSRSG